MPKFSNKSKEKLWSCDPRLQELCNEVIKDYDFTVICGHRNENDQNIAFEKGASKLKWPNSKHNKIPSQAVDIAPYNDIIKGIDWNDHVRFKELAECMKLAARKLGIKIRWGGDWDGNGKQDDKFLDFVHFEIAN
jgi:peptidoglycan L-alanyl-D-glutamate endopeptidase CwlK